MQFHAPKTLLSSILLLTSLAGCSGHFTKTSIIKNGKLAFTDAKTSVSITGTHQFYNDEGILSAKITRFCSGVSPDSMSAIAATTGVNADVAGKGNLGVSSGVSESLAYIGTRTAATSALRDLTYRNCEAFFNGALTKEEMATIMKRYTSSLVSLISIEQLTGAVRVPPTVIVTGASTGNAETIAKLTEQTSLQRDKVNALKSKEADALVSADTARTLFNDTDKDLLTKKPAADQAKTDIAVAIAASNAPLQADKDLVAAYEKIEAAHAEQKKDAEEKEALHKTAKKTLEEGESAFTAIDAARKAALVAGGSVSGATTVGSIPAAQPLSDEAVKTIADAVKTITLETIKLRYSNEVCATILTKAPTLQVDPSKITPLSICAQQIADGHAFIGND